MKTIIKTILLHFNARSGICIRYGRPIAQSANQYRRPIDLAPCPEMVVHDYRSAILPL